MPTETEANEISLIIEHSIKNRTLKKLILSKPADKDIIKTVCRIIKIKDSLFIQCETFTADNKALHKNIPENNAPELISSLIGSEYFQCNILDENGECEIKAQKSGGKHHIQNKIKPPKTGSPINLECKYRDDEFSHNRQKNHILDETQIYDFLISLEISDENGRIFDKKRSKFRQINRFLEILSDIYGNLPRNGVLHICDLCCGKSYLTFAVYYYLTEVKKRDVEMFGIDLKQDVIEYCASVAEKLGYSGLHFFCKNISDFVPEHAPDLTVSLHACDIATDIVLANAIKWHTKVILSTPCCHHEMMHQLDCKPLGFISDYSMLRQKLCDAATDALRAKLLESEGYDVSVIELIDPEETPKNVMIRAVHSRITPEKELQMRNARAEYEAACAFLSVTPYLDKLIRQ